MDAQILEQGKFESPRQDCDAGQEISGPGMTAAVWKKSEFSNVESCGGSEYPSLKCCWIREKPNHDVQRIDRVHLVSFP